MKIYKTIYDFECINNTVVTIGTFDGVHIGHTKILSRVKNICTDTQLNSLVFTFEPHPRTILFPEQKDLKLLTTPQEKAALLDSLAIDYLVEYPFTKEFSQIDSLKYVKEILVEKLKMKKLVIGYDHRFGKNREGSIDTLKKMSTGLGFEVEEISVQEVDEINVSSTRIRRALEDGNIKLANSYLGYSYFLTGMVIEGKKLGRKLGFPTANLALNNELKLIPKTGVYAVKIIIEGNNKQLKGMMSIGVNPTTDKDNTIKIEVNIFDFNEDLYGKKIQVNVFEYIRPELKFTGLAELIAAIEDDKVKAMEILVT